MLEDDLLDQQTRPREKFNKNTLLYALVTVCFLGFLFERMNWPGYSLLIIFGGGLSVGFIAALLVYFKQHFFFENAGMFLYGSFITFTVITRFIYLAWLMYFGTLLLCFVLSVWLLRDKEIV